MRSPEELAREKIDALLEQCGWILQNRSTINLSAGRGIAILGIKVSEDGMISGYKKELGDGDEAFKLG
jgi:hypothetical protein